ncbi:hypothetical protein [Actinophytocola sp.]|uniref:hypothetical protein n=1 Tax=Actinophytocola sp. TaxID=1872138 RepID=UPI002D7E97A7|nr:hypothetical protein [Actinophytocola sp.]HET9141799.1 hypothetical protein [Actinophytocola sp.]
MTDVEELIRDTLRRQESRAPDPGPVLAALRRPVRRPAPRRSRGLVGGLAVAIAVAVVVITIPAGIQQLTGPRPEPDGPGGGTGATEVPPAGLLRYTAAWLPPGFTEVYRAVGPDGRQHRQWAAGTVRTDSSGNPLTPLITLSVHTPAEPSWADTPQAISEARDTATVAGHPAGFPRLDASGGRLIWMPDAGTILQVSLVKVADARQTALRIAESVRPDGGSAVRPGIRFGSLPAPLAEETAGVRGSSPADATTELVAAEPGAVDDRSPTVQVTLSPQALESGGEPVTVRGRTGTYVAPVDRRSTEHNDITPARLAVRLDDGRWLTLDASSVSDGTGGSAPTPLSRDQLIDILNTLVFRTPDYTWLGR